MMRKPITAWVRDFLPFSTCSGLLAPVRIWKPAKIIRPSMTRPARGRKILTTALTMPGRVVTSLLSPPASMIALRSGVSGVSMA